jgi:hypothetical protein
VPAIPFNRSAIDPNLYYSYAEAAALVGKTRRTIEWWRARGLFKQVAGRSAKRRDVLARGSDLPRIMVGLPEPQEIEGPVKRSRRIERMRVEYRAWGL